jgi:hypothetical protein
MMRRHLTGLAAMVLLAAAIAGGSVVRHAAADRAGASVPSALEIADHGLTTVAGPDDEGSYALIDPIGPGGVKSVEAADEVFATTLQGGKYEPWQAYRDPFAPPPAAPPAPYPAIGTKPYGNGGGR